MRQRWWRTPVGVRWSWEPREVRVLSRREGLRSGMSAPPLLSGMSAPRLVSQHFHVHLGCSLKVLFAWIWNAGTGKCRYPALKRRKNRPTWIQTPRWRVTLWSGLHWNEIYWINHRNAFFWYINGSWLYASFVQCLNFSIGCTCSQEKKFYYARFVPKSSGYVPCMTFNRLNLQRGGVGSSSNFDICSSNTKLG